MHGVGSRDLTARDRRRGSVAARPAPIVAVGALFALGLVDSQGTPLKVSSIESLHGASGIRIRHFHKAESTRVAGLAVRNQCHAIDRAVLRKQCPYGILGRCEGQISNI
jgi:hypothetical protein